jgi:hypothetical protein
MSNFNTTSNENQNIYPKPCVYNCNTQIYWNTSENAYLEVFTKKKHICPNRTNSSKSTTTNNTAAVSKPNYYNKFAKQPKPKMSNSLELLTGPITEIQKKYEILSDIITELGGKTHGSQSHIGPNNSISLVVYYEVPAEGNKREVVKQRFNNIIRNNRVILQR